MKACPLCKSTYDDWIDFCFNDGMPLVAQAAAAAAGGPSLESILDAPDIPLSLMDAPEPAALKRAPEPAPAAEPPAARPLVIGAAGFDVGPTHAPEPPPPPTPAPVVPGGMDSAAVAELASVLGGAAPPPSNGVATPPPLMEMPVPSGFALPEAPRSSAAAAPVAPVVAAPVTPAAPVVTPPAPTVERAPTPPRTEPTPTGGGFPLSPVALGGVALAALAAAGVIWVLIKPGPAPEGPPVAEVGPPAPAPTPTPAPSAPTPGVPPAAVPAPDAAAVAPVPPATPPGVPPVVSVASPTTPVTPTPTPGPTPTPTPAPTPTAVAVIAPPPGEPAPWGGATSPATPSSGTLRVLTDPEGASVTVDDQPRGTSPVTLDLPFGPHRVKVERAGFKAEAREVDLQGAEITVPFNLKPEVVTGQVNVYGPIGWRVTVDGHDMGPVPVTVQVAEGVRQFKLTGDAGQGCVIPREVTFHSPGKAETVTLACP